MIPLVPVLLHPEWCLALVPLPFVLWLLGRRRAADPWAGIIDPALLERLRVAPGRRRQWRLLAIALAWCLAVLALTGPSWQPSPTATQRNGGALVILLDLSLSMYARDVAPSRVARARQEIEDLSRGYQGGRVALIAYAGDAHVVTPLTDDARTVINLLAALEPSVMPLPGSDLAAALALAEQLLQRSGEQIGGVIVVTDEISNLAQLEVFDDPRFPVSVLGVGTATGGTVPLDFTGERGQLLTDSQGVPVMPQVDHARLAEAAQSRGGAYATASADRHDTATLLAAVGRRATVQDGERRTAGAERMTWQDQGYWLVLLLLPLCAYGFRRGVLLMLVAIVGFAAHSPTSFAADAPSAQGSAGATPTPWASRWQQLWARPDQRGARALDAGRPDLAALLFRDPAWRAAALYRSGRYASAAALYRRDNSADGAYNLGNALAKQGDLPGAIAAYERALTLAPDHADARFNRDLLRRRQPPQAPEQDPDKGSQSRRGGARDAPPRADPNAASGTPREQPPGTPPRQRPSTPAGEAADRRGSEALADESPEERTERQRATEQWLRRVPDVPGALLRRKFAAETALRGARGEVPAAPDRLW